MKWSIPLLMLLVMIMPFSKGMIWLEFQLNKDFISQNLCVNKSKPKLHCNGKCQLMKKMAEEEKQDVPVPFQKLAPVFCETDVPVFVHISRFVKEIKTVFNRFRQNSSYSSPVFPVFHPPAWSRSSFFFFSTSCIYGF